MTTSEDLFLHKDLLPVEITALLEKYSDADCYASLNALLNECEELGYTFDYYLDAEPFNLRKIEI